MPRVSVSREAVKDLNSMRDYIRDDLCNPTAATYIMGEIKKSILSLSDFFGRGRPLDALISVHTEYRYLVCEHYCVFYAIDDNGVLIRTAGDNPGYFALGFMSEKSNHSYRYVWLYKCRAKPVTEKYIFRPIPWYGISFRSAHTP